MENFIDQKLMKEKINILIRKRLDDKGMTISTLRRKIGMERITMNNRLYKPFNNHWKLLEVIKIFEVLEINLNKLKDV
jgi:lambda repressor-like predicted transcriptional regulator|tara:strand:- start:392 stop:625 length:234 start_codon:yes stop_codon:yes gene_type:complete